MQFYTELAMFYLLKPPQMRDLDDVLKETTAANPYDATRAGPMCEQSNRSPASIDNLNDIIINDVVENILEVTNC